MTQLVFALLTVIISSCLGGIVVTRLGAELLAPTLIVCMVLGWKMSDWADAFERKYR